MNIGNKNLTKTHDFILGPIDTDSISFCKPDMSEFTEEEQDQLLEEINSYFPELIKYDHDGYFSSCCIVRAKNYILFDGDKVKIKGSALKGSTKEKALKEMIGKFVDCLIKDNYDPQQLVSIYNDYVKEAKNVTDINRWCSRKTITDKILNPERTNEQKVLDALEDSEFQEGDRKYFYFKEDGSLGLAEHFDGCYNKDRLYEKIWKTAAIFETIVDKSLFIKYHLKKNRELVENL